MPLCGAALTFFAAAKKVSKESGLTPPAPKRVPWLGGGSGTSGISAPAHSAFVTRQSYFPPRTSCSPERAFFSRCVGTGAIAMLGNSLSTPWFFRYANARAALHRRQVAQTNTLNHWDMASLHQGRDLAVSGKHEKVAEEPPLRRAKRRRKNDCLVTNAECAGALIPDAPLAPPS